MKGPYLPIEFPTSNVAASINHPFPIGRSTQDGSAVLLDLSQGGGFIAGQQCGVTTMLHSITANLANMPDVLIWQIDLANSLAGPWHVDPDSNVVDWVAVTEAVALQMVQAAVRIAKRRRTHYAAEMLGLNRATLPAKSNVPQIVILIDKELDFETAVGQKIAWSLSELRRIGRAMRVIAVSAYPRATGDWMPMEEKDNASFALCGRVKDQAELAYVFGWDKELPELTRRGHFAFSDGGGEGRGVERLDAFMLTPAGISRIAASTKVHRTQTRLDEPSAEAAGPDYANRWEEPSTKEYLAFLRGGEVTDTAVDVLTAAREVIGENTPDTLDTLDDVMDLVTALIGKLKSYQKGA